MNKRVLSVDKCDGIERHARSGHAEAVATAGWTAGTRLQLANVEGRPVSLKGLQRQMGGALFLPEGCHLHSSNFPARDSCGLNRRSRPRAIRYVSDRRSIAA